MSDASARVGHVECTIDSSIWVAVIVGWFPTGEREQALLDERHLLDRQLDPRSPRAIMIASDASTISSTFSTACGSRSWR